MFTPLSERVVGVIIMLGEFLDTNLLYPSRPMECMYITFCGNVNIHTSYIQCHYMLQKL